MRQIIFLFVAIFFLVSNYTAQSILSLKQKCQSYLDLNNQLSSKVKFFPDKIVFYNSKGTDELVIYQNEIYIIGKMLESQSNQQLQDFFIYKKIRNLTKKEKDSILINLDENTSVTKKNALPLSGIRIAIDPGHFSADLNTALVEQRSLNFTYNNHGKTDTIKLIEGYLTFLTAEILGEKLKALGAEVFITRKSANSTAFGISFNSWYLKRKNKVLDSLLLTHQIDNKKYTQLKTCSKQKFFQLFFREYELLERARIINNFNPHLSVIIHYNVDENNNPWKQPTENNYSMCFIGGAFLEDDLDKIENKIHFLRLLLTDHIEKSEKISGYAMYHFENNLNVLSANASHANYLKKYCIPTKNKGVYCRNLLLTRYISSPLVYGESMCQDNIYECLSFSKNDYTVGNKKIPYRIYQVADSYYKSILEYFDINLYHKN